MSVPFLVFGLPRSRTYWLSRFLAYGGRKVEHDVEVRCASMHELADVFATGELDGSVSSSGAFYWREALKVFGKCKLVVVRRDVEEAIASFHLRRQAGRQVPRAPEEVRNMAILLDHFSSQCGVTTLQYEALETEAGCAWLFEHCLEVPHDSQWWERLASVNLQDPIAQTNAKHYNNAHKMKTFWNSIDHSLPEICPVSFSHEPFMSIWPEVQPLLLLTAGDKEPFILSPEVMEKMSREGTMRFWVARERRRLVGVVVYIVRKHWQLAGEKVAGIKMLCAPNENIGEGLKLRSQCDLAREGVKQIRCHTATETIWLGE